MLWSFHIGNDRRRLGVIMDQGKILNSLLADIRGTALARVRVLAADDTWLAGQGSNTHTLAEYAAPILAAVKAEQEVSRMLVKLGRLCDRL